MDFSRELFEKLTHEFTQLEKELLEYDINERTITHKFAEYLNNKSLFPWYSIDCEYNRMLDEWTKSFITKKLRLDIENVESDDNNWITVYPDIIVHKRWNNSDNLLIIEIKKKNYAQNIKEKETGKTYRDFDFEKIKLYMQQLSYKNWLYIEFDWLNKPFIIVF